MAGLSIRVVSDVHLEINRPLDWSEIVCPIEHSNNKKILILAGDIGYPGTPIYKDFLKHSVHNFDHVLVIAGNHEHYHGGHIDKIHRKMHADCKSSGAVCLQNRSVVINKVKFIGATGWTKLHNDVKPFIDKDDDFKHIHNMTFDKFNQLHVEDLQFIRDEVENSEYPVVVITHHPPSERMSKSEYNNSVWQSKMFFDHEDNIKPPIILWINGHTHHTRHEILDNGVHLYSNSHGFRDREHTGFDKNKIIEI